VNAEHNVDAWRSPQLAAWLRMEALGRRSPRLRAGRWRRPTREALDVMFRVTGLGLNAIHSFVKWATFLNEPGRSAPWKQLHALYTLAESDASYSQVPFVLQRGPSRASSRGAVRSTCARSILDLLNPATSPRSRSRWPTAGFSSGCKRLTRSEH